MKSRAWMTRERTTGEMPFKVIETEQAEFVLDFAGGVEIQSFSSPGGTTLLPGDFCIVVGEVTDVAADADPIDIAVAILAVNTCVAPCESRRAI